MKARKNQFFLAGIDVDVADRENTGNIGHELFGIDDDLAAVDFQSPIGDRPQFGRQTVKYQQAVQRNASGDAIQTGDLDFRQLAVFYIETGDLSGDGLHAEILAQCFHL